jgi:Tol biopolymer transport system component
MDAAMTASVMDEAAPGVRRRPWFWIAATGLLLLAAILIPYVAGYFPSASRPTATFRFTVSPPPNTSFNSAGGTNAPYVTLAPNGRMAFIAVSNGKRQIWVRELHSLEARVLPGTEDVAPYPVFWSPDSNFIGFGQLEKLKKIAVSGGLPQTICDAPYYESGTWNRDDVIVFSEVNQGEGPLKRVSAAGGQPEVLTRLDETRKDRGHGFPYFLPDGDHFLFLARAEDAQNSAILAGSLSSGETSVVVKAHSRMAYERAGFLIFTRDAALMAQPFDARKLQVTGPAFPIADKVRYNPGPGQASLAISENGILAYRAGIDQEDTKLVWKDRSGNVVGEFGPLGNYRNPELSPDDRRVAIQRRDLETTADDIWTIEVLRGASIRLTTSEEPDVLPVWSPDGTRILFLRGGALYIQPANGVGSEELLIKGPFRPFDWSSENRIIYQADGTQILSLPLTANPQPELYFKSDSIKSNGQLSPDGRWLAYQSNESGRTEVYVQSFPNPSSRGVASPGGGSSPRWGHAGNELFYVDQERRLVAVKVRKVATGLEFSPPVPLFELELNPGTRHPYDVARDGRFLVLQGGDAGDTPITVVVGWADSLKK